VVAVGEAGRAVGSGCQGFKGCDGNVFNKTHKLRPIGGLGCTRTSHPVFKLCQRDG
jgi:hypothetical protein